MEWTDIRLTVAKADADNAEAVATMIAEGGIYIEDYSDIEQQVAEIAHVDLIEQELLDKPRDQVIIHMYLEPGASPVETLALIAARMEAAGIPYTAETEGVEQEDWQNGWRKYYHPMDIGQHLAIVPSWQEYDTDRVKLILDPGLAFGTGGHETTSLCLEALDEGVRGGERVLDIGTGSGILAIAALKLGAGSAEGVDIDPVAVRTAGENAALNGVADKLTVLVGDLSDKASGRYDIITANIVANAIISLAPAEPSVEVTLFVGYPKQDKLEQVIRHGVELGCTHFVPFFSRYCVAAPKKEEQKNERYNRIAFEAAKQCGRGVLPDVALPLPNFGALCRSLEGYDLVLFCYELGGAPLRQLLADAQPADGQRLKIALITGAEGGFAVEEAEMAANAGVKTVGLGPRILRCETAPLAVLSAVMTLTGNLE